MPQDDIMTETEWGFIDDDGVFTVVPKQPLRLAGLTNPPFEVRMWNGKVRRIIERKDNE
jgi:hypothetical protein